MTDADKVLASSFDQEIEWTAFVAQTKRVINKRDLGGHLTNADSAMLAAYRCALALAEPPKHKVTKDNLPPVLRGYNEAADAFGVTRGQLYGLRQRKSPAFYGNVIYTASLAADLAREPNPVPVAPNLVHTGRKGLLNPKLSASILAALQKTPILSMVAQSHGISPATLAGWRLKGAEGDSRYVDFFNKTEEALANSKLCLLGEIAGNPDWRAKLAVLERLDDKFCKTTAHTISGPAGGPIVTKGDGPPAPVIIQLSGVTANIYDPTTPPPPESEVPA